MTSELTKNFESFLDNNTPGGYVQTSISISDDNLSDRINEVLNTKGYLTSNSHLPWNQIDNKPAGTYITNINNLTGSNISITGSNIAVSSNDNTTIATAINNLNTAINGTNNNGSSLNLATVATTGDYEDLLNKPTLVTNNDIDIAINGLKGNPSALGQTLEALDNNKSSIVYLNVAEEPYNFINFGWESFFDKNTTLITDIINYINNKKMVILISGDTNWLITNFQQRPDLGVSTISILSINTTYYNVLNNASNNVQHDNNETEEEYEIRFNEYIFNNIEFLMYQGVLIYDENSSYSYFIFHNMNYDNIIIDLISRIEALEG